MAKIGFIVIPLFTGSAVAYHFFYWLRSPKHTTILVANFEGPDLKNYRVTEILIEQLREATRTFPDVKVQGLGDPITAHEGSDVARAKGKAHHATIVLWGWYGKTSEKALITIHFEVLRQPSILYLSREKETLSVAVAEFESFTIQERLSRQMGHLTLMTIGLARYEAQAYTSAITLFTEALSQGAVPEQMINPAYIYFYRGTAYALSAEHDHAIADFTQAITLSPKYAQAYNNRGFVYYEKRDYNRALADLDQAISLNPNLAEAYNNRGLVYHQKGNYAQAIADYNQVVAPDPDAVFFNNRGAAYLSNGEYDRALADLNQALALRPNFAPIYANRGAAYFGNGEYDRALADLDQAISLNPNLAKAYNNRGLVYYRKWDYDQALTDFNEAVRLEPDNDEAYYNRGALRQYLFPQSDTDKAITDMQKALELTNNPWIRKNAKEQLQRLGIQSP
jgi:tetratricopeptide (TPR) repeat protein